MISEQSPIQSCHNLPHDIVIISLMRSLAVSRSPDLVAPSLGPHLYSNARSQVMMPLAMLPQPLLPQPLLPQPLLPSTVLPPALYLQPMAVGAARIEGQRLESIPPPQIEERYLVFLSIHVNGIV